MPEESRLDYESHPAAAAAKGRRGVPAWVAAASLTPMGLFFVVAYTSDRWGRWLQLGQGWERLLGLIWIATAAWSVAWAVGLAVSRKRWPGWTCLALHAGFVAFTILPPGSIGLAWLMHWMHGPGA